MSRDFKKISIVIIITFLALAFSVSANILSPFEDVTNDIDVDDYWLDEDETIQTRDYAPDAHETNEQNLKETDYEEGIDFEEELGVNQIINFLIITASAIIIFVAIAFLMSLKKFSGFALMILSIVVMVFAAGIVTVIFTNSNFFTQWIYGDDEALWKDKKIEIFNLGDVKDMPLQYDHSETIEELNTYMSIPPESVLEIEEAKHYAWADNQNSREAVIIEFADSDAAKKFVNTVFDSKAKLSMRREDYEWGELTVAKDGQYQNPYLMQENKFVFMVFGDKEYSENTLNKIIDYYPEEYHYKNDDKGPIIEIISPDEKFITSEKIEFKIIDEKSGINPLSISIINTKTKFDPTTHCRSSSEDSKEYTCILPNGIDAKKDSFRIYASDLEHNYANKEILYFFDNEKPSIKIFGEGEIGEVFIFEVIDNHNSSIKQVSIKSSKQNNDLSEECNKADGRWLCNIQTTKYIGQGEVSFSIIAIDIAGNIAQQKVTTIIDTKLPYIEFINPIGEMSNENVLEFNIKDDESGIDENLIIVELNNKKTKDLCQKVNNNYFKCKEREILTSGINTLKVIAKDFKNNELIFEKNIEIDSENPSVVILSADNVAESNLRFALQDLNSGISMDNIIINGNSFEVGDICESEGARFICEYNLDLSSGKVLITAWDNANNVINHEEVIE